MGRRQHGTERGYAQHYRLRDLPVCDPCRQANKIYKSPAAVAARRAARSVPRRKAAACGTDSGYQRHRQTTHTPVCERCAEAHRARGRAYRQANPQQKPRTHCRSGRHEWTPDNVVRWYDRRHRRYQRKCRACDLERRTGARNVEAA